MTYKQDIIEHNIMQTYILNICSIFFVIYIDNRTHIRYNSDSRTNVRNSRSTLYMEGDVMSIEEREEKLRINHIRREIQLRRHLMILFGVIATICIISVVIISCISVKAADCPESEKCYKSVMIDYGESLDNLTASNYDSMHYNDTSDFKKEVTSINHLVAEDVHPGQYIVIPYYKSIK